MRYSLHLIVFRLSKVLLLCVLVFGLTAACSYSDPIKVGFVDGLTGQNTDLGLNNRDGALLAIERRNASGGVSGRRIELVIKDDKHNPEVAQMVVREMIADGVVAIIGHGTSNTTIATAPIANAAQTVMISPTATAKELTGKYEYFFRVVQPTDQYAAKNALFRHKVLKEKRIAVAYDTHNRAYSESWMDDFRQVFVGEGGKLSVVIGFDSANAQDMGRLADQLLGSKPDGVLIISSSSSAALLCRQIRQRHTSINIGTSEWAATEKLVKLGGKAVEGIYSSQFIDLNNKKPGYVAFRAEYVRRFGREPGFAAVASYDATNVILDSLDKNAEKISLAKTILSISTFSGLQGPLRFGSSQDAARPSYITTILNGKFHTYEN